ncbi:MAG TPA: hypothetical protein VFV50_10470 [Bdellovibrionales bacterium]|nr:hypothetical protein [Bdellovibrionales bacterium]
MTHFGKNFVFAALSLLFTASPSVASLDTNVFDLETKHYKNIEKRAQEKMAPCEKLDLDQDLEYRDCLIDAAMFALSARDSKNDGVSRVFDNVFSKIDESLKPGAALIIAQKAVEGFKSSTNVADRATYYEVLKNLMGLLPTEKDDFRATFQFIKDNDFEIPDDVKNERMKRLAVKTADLGELAEVVLSTKLSKSTTAEVTD